jgi:hypothetical protein
VEIPPADRTPTELRLILPDDAAAQSQWAAGLYSVTADVTRDGSTRRSNVLPLPLAPRISAISPDPAVRDGAGAVTLDVQCRPRVRDDQAVVLLLAGREVRAEPLTGASATVQFVIPDAPVGVDQLVQLRVDGVGSLPFRFNDTAGRLEFDDNQRITVQ